jgi:hypothetical protein
MTRDVIKYLYTHCFISIHILMWINDAVTTAAII